MHDQMWPAAVPLFELAWNGFDAGASFVAVTVVENEIHGVERVVVLDDGEGIEFATLDHTFGNFNDSSKKARQASSLDVR